MSNSLINAETHIGAAYRLAQSCLHLEATPLTSQQPFRLSAIDYKFLLAITIEPYSTRRTTSSYLATRPPLQTSSASPTFHRRPIPRSIPRPGHFLQRAGITTDARNATDNGEKGSSIEKGPAASKRTSKQKAGDTDSVERIQGFFSKALQDLNQLEKASDRTKIQRRRQKQQSSKATNQEDEISSVAYESKSTVTTVNHGAETSVETNLSSIESRSTPAEAAPRIFAPGETNATSLKWVNVPLNYPLERDNQSIDLYTNGTWKAGSAGYLAKLLWRMFSNESTGGPSVESLLPTLPVSRYRAKDLFLRHSNVDSIREEWLALPEYKRVSNWRHVVLYSVATSVKRTFIFLEATHQTLPYVPWMFIYTMSIMRWWRWEQVDKNPELRQQYDHLLQWAINKSIEVQHIPSWKAISLYLENSTAEQGKALFDICLKKPKDMSSTMGLRFMNFFTKAGNVEYGLKAFHEAAKDLKILGTEFMLRSCSALLQLDHIERRDHSQNFKILPEMLGAGVEPNMIIHNIAISNSFKNDLSGVGWDVFNHMRTNNLPTDSHTFLYMLQDCVKTGDVSRMSEILAMINERDDLSNNIYLLGETLHAIQFLHKTQELVSSSGPFEQMLSFYCHKLKVTPLLHMLELPLTVDPISEASKVEPSVLILQMMISSYILKAATPTAAVRLWVRFRSLVSQQDPTALSLATSDHIYNTFLISFSRSSATITNLLEVLDFMIKADAFPSHCAPSDTTFIIVATALLRHEKPVQAKKVLEIMRMRGLDINMNLYDEAAKNRPHHARLIAQAIHILERIEREMLDRSRGKSQDLENLESWANAVTATNY